MVFFETDRSKFERNQARLKYLYNKRRRVFALFPTGLADGRVAWLQYIWKDYGVYKSSRSGDILVQWKFMIKYFDSDVC